MQNLILGVKNPKELAQALHEDKDYIALPIQESEKKSLWRLIKAYLASFRVGAIENREKITRE